LLAEVYVVDSGSSDDTPDAVSEAFPQVRLIASKENLGFSAANNLALRQIGFGENRSLDTLPRAAYLLNPDTITQPGATRALYDTLMSNPSAGLVGARLTYGDSRFQHSAFGFPGLRQLWVEFFPTPGRLIEGAFNGRYPRNHYDVGRPFPVDFTLGATMMLKREVIEQTGMFDPQFFMYCEEIDWAWRIHKAGWDVLCVPQAHVIHLAGQSASQIRPQTVLRLWKSRLRLYDKHYPPWKRMIVRLMVAAGMGYRIRRLSRHATDADEALRTAYQEIFTLALKR
jgi:hypothetical protein